MSSRANDLSIWHQDCFLRCRSAGVPVPFDLGHPGREAGPQVAQAVQLGIEYDPQPPFDAGSPSKAPASIVAAVSAIAAAGDEWLGARARD